MHLTVRAASPLKTASQAGETALQFGQAAKCMPPPIIEQPVESACSCNGLHPESALGDCRAAFKFPISLEILGLQTMTMPYSCEYVFRVKRTSNRASSATSVRS